MPTICGTPIQAGLTYNWVDIAHDEFAGVMQSSVMRGQPVPLEYWQRRSVPGPTTIAQGIPFWIQSRPYDRGAGAFAPHFGFVPVNPIGAGIYSPYKLPVIAGPGARYAAGAIWFDVQSVPTTLRMNPTVPIETVNALIQQSYVAASYATTG